MNIIDKNHVKGFFIGAAVAAALLSTIDAYGGDPPPTSFRPNGGISTDSKAMLGAQRLFRVEDCEVWGFNWRNQDRVVAVCPQSSHIVSGGTEIRPVVNTPPAPGALKQQ